MKRQALIRYLEKKDCGLYREGKNHTIYYNPAKQKLSTIPRHSEIVDWLANKICKDRGVLPPK